jgi:hypothetical protein
LDVSVSFPDAKTCASIEQTLRQGLAGDPRQLLVRVQGGGGYGPWCFWIQWGEGPNCRGTKPTILSDAEHTPEAVLARVKEQLSTMQVANQSHQAARA